MIKSIIVILLIFILPGVCSCSSADAVDIDSEAGAYYVMFKTVIDAGADIADYKYLSFDAEGSGLEGEALEELEKLISDYCRSAGVEYMNWSKTRLMRAGKFSKSVYGNTFTGGYLLEYYGCSYSEDDNGEYYTGNLTLWHSDYELIGGIEFVIRKSKDGWYLDKDAENGGYNTIMS